MPHSRRDGPYLLFAIAGLIAIGVAGCAPKGDDLSDSLILGDGTVTATVLQTTAAPGAVVEVRFVSTSTNDFGFSACGRLVERRVGETWEPIPPEDRMCIAVVDLVSARATVTYQVDVPADATPGTYRFVFEMLTTAPEGGGIRMQVASAPFRVE